MWPPGFRFLLMASWSHYWEGSVTTLHWKINKILDIPFFLVTTLTTWRKTCNKEVLDLLLWFKLHSFSLRFVPKPQDVVALVLNATLLQLWLLHDEFPVISPDSNPLTLVTNFSAFLIINMLLTFLTCILSPFTRDLLINIVLLTFEFLEDTCQVPQLSS